MELEVRNTYEVRNSVRMPVCARSTYCPVPVYICTFAHTCTRTRWYVDSDLRGSLMQPAGTGTGNCVPTGPGHDAAHVAPGPSMLNVQCSMTSAVELVLDARCSMCDARCAMPRCQNPRCPYPYPCSKTKVRIACTATAKDGAVLNKPSDSPFKFASCRRINTSVDTPCDAIPARASSASPCLVCVSAVLAFNFAIVLTRRRPSSCGS